MRHKDILERFKVDEGFRDLLTDIIRDDGYGDGEEPNVTVDKEGKVTTVFGMPFKYVVAAINPTDSEEYYVVFKLGEDLFKFGGWQTSEDSDAYYDELIPCEAKKITRTVYETIRV